MAESSLTLGWSDYKSEVGYYLGYGRTSANWTTAQTTEIESFVHGGLRQFYLSPPVQGKPHKWSFLTIQDTQDTAASDYDITLPDDFGNIEGTLTYATDSGQGCEIRIVPENLIRKMRQADTSTGVPQYAAIRSRASDGSTGQKLELILWPTPDGIYTLGYRYQVIPEKLSDSAPYALGGSYHSDTILQSCLAVAELRANDEKGIQWDKFMERLSASIQYDMQQTPEYYGYNRDLSDGGYLRVDDTHVATVNGVTPS